MDDTQEEEAPKARPRTGKGDARKAAADAPAARPKARSGSARQAKAEGEKAEKPASRRKSKTAAAGAEKKPPAKKTRAPAKPGQSRRTPGETVAELPPAPKVLAHAKASPPEPQPPAPAGLPQAEPQGVGPVGDVTIHPIAPHVPSVNPHDEGLEFGLSPVDLAPDSKVREEAGFGWFIRILALSSVLLVLFNSFAIDKWSREQPVTPLNSRVLIAAQQLHAEMKSFHLDAPLEGMRSLWHGIRDARWPGSAGNREKSGEENPPAK